MPVIKKERAKMPTAKVKAEEKTQEPESEQVQKPKEEEMERADTDDLKREQRQKEWGTQFDKFLINCNQRKRLLTVTTSDKVFNVTKDGNVLEAMVEVVDRDFVCFLLGDSSKVWLNKSHIVSAKIVGNATNPRPAETS